MKPRLGVNIDHVATLRQARGENYPSLVDAAHAVFDAGADQLTIHLREDRRHIQDYDLPAMRMICDQYQRPLNLEMGANEEIFELAVANRPEWICIVPEKREERTTEGGLSLAGENYQVIRNLCQKIRSDLPESKISLFVEADSQTMKQCAELKPDAVEIHTGEYAHLFNRNEDLSSLLEQFKNGASIMRNAGVAYHAGHGLDNKNIVPLLELGVFHEYNVGHWIICQSLFEGLNETVTQYRKLITSYEVKK